VILSWPDLKSSLSMVLLPLPLAPTTAQLVPAGTLNETPFRMLASWRYLQQGMCLQPSTVCTPTVHCTPKVHCWRLKEV
jgi:hypothetical protein